MNHLNGHNILAILTVLWIQPSSNALSIHPKATTYPPPPPKTPHDAPQNRPTTTTTIHNPTSLTPPSPTTTRRNWCHDQLLPSCLTLLAAAATTTSIVPSPATAAETIGKDPNCADASCAGVWDGLLADCPHGGLGMNLGAGCVSSQDDTPGIFAEPWDYSDAPNDTLDWQKQMDVLLPALQSTSSRRSDTLRNITQSGRYLRVLFVDGRTGEESTGEFYFTPNDTTVQFRVGSMGGGRAGGRRNMERCEAVRKELGYERLTVLRNRKRVFFFGESGLDGFGPGSAMLGPPAEMTTGELEGRQDVDPRLKIDFVQSFPLK